MKENSIRLLFVYGVNIWTMAKDLHLKNLCAIVTHQLGVSLSLQR